MAAISLVLVAAVVLTVVLTRPDSSDGTKDAGGEVTARLRAVFDAVAAGPLTASATDASTVAFQVRKSLAEKSPPVTCLT